jgi:predicted nuclease of predicted toxin-antitoxin system
VKLLFDQNLSPRLPNLLADLFPDSQHVRSSGMNAAADPVVWLYARVNGFIIVSKDDDFQQIAQREGSPPKVIRIALGNCPTKRVVDLLRDRFLQIESFANNPITVFLELP